MFLRYSAMFLILAAETCPAWGAGRLAGPGAATVGLTALDAANAITADASGNIYVAGSRSGRAAFVTKLSPDGSYVMYTRTFGGSGTDIARALTVDAAGNVYVVGSTDSRDFPVTAGCLQASPGGQEDAFIARLDTAGRLVYASYLGDAATDIATAVAVDSSGHIYVAGYTASTRFPTTQAASQRVHHGGFYDSFVAKLNATGAALVYSTLLGGAGIDVARALRVDGAGNACIAGYTDSASLPGLQMAAIGPTGNGDALVACINPLGTAWNYIVTVGGRGVDAANGLDIDARGAVYVTGDTYSDAFPASAGAYQPARAGQHDAFVAKLDPKGKLKFATLLGGSAADAGTAVAVDVSGRAWVAGFTTSGDFPRREAWQGAGGSFDAFISQISADGSSLLFSSYFGDSGDDRAWGIVIGPSAVLVTGATLSTSFPATVTVMRPPIAGSSNGFVLRIPALTTAANTRSAKPTLYRAGKWYAHGPENTQASFQEQDKLFTWGGSGLVPVFGDWNGDGRMEAGVFDRGVWCLDVNGNGIFEVTDRVFGWGNADCTPVVGDWNYDGGAKAGAYCGGLWYLDYNGNMIFDAADRVFGWGDAGCIPVVGDWNGDGRSKAGAYCGGIWYLDVNGNGVFEQADSIIGWGGQASVPVVGDWNGDGRSKIGVSHDGLWFLDYNGNGWFDHGDRVFGWGGPGSVPVVGDWNGDGRTEVAIVDGAGTWYIDSNGNQMFDAGDQVLSGGQPGDVPLAVLW